MAEDHQGLLQNPWGRKGQPGPHLALSLLQGAVVHSPGEAVGNWHYRGCSIILFSHLLINQSSEVPPLSPSTRNPKAPPGGNSAALTKHSHCCSCLPPAEQLTTWSLRGRGTLVVAFSVILFAATKRHLARLMAQLDVSYMRKAGASWGQETCQEVCSSDAYQSRATAHDWPMHTDCPVLPQGHRAKAYRTQRGDSHLVCPAKVPSRMYRRQRNYKTARLQDYKAQRPI